MSSCDNVLEVEIHRVAMSKAPLSLSKIMNLLGLFLTEGDRWKVTAVFSLFSNKNTTKYAGDHWP